MVEGVAPIDIRALRSRRGWTQAELARALGTDAVTISRWERGVSKPRPSAVKRLKAIDVASGPRSSVGFVEDPTTRLREVESALRQMKALKKRLVRI